MAQDKDGKVEVEEQVCYWLALGQPYLASVTSVYDQENAASGATVDLVYGATRVSHVTYDPEGQQQRSYCRVNDAGWPGTLAKPGTNEAAFHKSASASNRDNEQAALHAAHDDAVQVARGTHAALAAKEGESAGAEPRRSTSQIADDRANARDIESRAASGSPDEVKARAARDAAQPTASKSKAADAKATREADTKAGTATSGNQGSTFTPKKDDRIAAATEEDGRAAPSNKPDPAAARQSQPASVSGQQGQQGQQSGSTFTPKKEDRIAAATEEDGRAAPSNKPDPGAASWQSSRPKPYEPPADDDTPKKKW